MITNSNSNLNDFSSQCLYQHQSLPARSLKMQTPHGEVTTPCFMPVGTRAVLNYLTPMDLMQSQCELILGGNTYHMLAGIGLEKIEALGGMHKLMAWERAMLTDSGGFQVLSLAREGNICVVDEEGAHFKHPITGKIIHLNSETSIAAQKIIGADIIMAFDQCTPEEGGREMALAALKRTHEWLVRSCDAHAKNPFSAYGKKQALFGIIQGGSFRDLREQSLEFILSQPLDGIGIGGEVIGFDMAKTVEIIGWIRDALPLHKVRYTMGVGLCPEDLLAVVKAGVDIFDCVAPTRNARHGTLYCGEFIEQDDWLTYSNAGEPTRIHIKRSLYAKDTNPISLHCDCYTCLHFSRGYLHYLFKNKLMAYQHLASIHNIHVMQTACKRMQDLIQKKGKPITLCE